MNRPLASLALLAALLLAGCTSKEDPCHLPSLKCGDRCVDASTDPTNCGGCGVTCGPGQTCCGSCVDLQADPLHCSACGTRCAVDGVCSGGTCGCPASQPTLCGTNPGTCVNLTTGMGGYCGVCGVVCQGTGVAGTDATCNTSNCVCAGTAASTDCRATSPAVVCVNTLVDATNCGGCGQDCPPHATCASNGAPSPSGVCGCGHSEWPVDCGPTKGCVNTLVDPANCGTCGTACTGTTPTCSTGKCCPSGQTNCSGTCVDTRTSDAHCGACGSACGSGRTCAGGTCVCSGATPLTCGSTCCAGTGCCAGDTCQFGHSNGLGGAFHDCTATYTPATLDRPAALAAANSWNPGTTFDLICAGSCLARQTLSSCAMWCWQGTFAGHVTSGGIACDSLCNNFIGGSTPTWP